LLFRSLQDGSVSRNCFSIFATKERFVGSVDRVVLDEEWPEVVHRPPSGMLQTVDRALQLLLRFDRSRQDLGVTEVARDFGWDKSVAQRLLATLAYRGFLAYDPSSRRYRIGPAAIQLARVWERSGTLAMLVRPVLENLAARTGDTALLAVPDGVYTRCVAAVDGQSGPQRIYPLVGELYPGHTGATSKAYFAFLPPEQRQRLFAGRPMARFTDNTRVDPDVLEREFLEDRARGYAFTVGEYDAGVAALAVPVYVRGELFGSLTLGGPAAQFGEVTAARIDGLQRAARYIDTILSGPLAAPRSGKEAR
jgi:DNA-binding IclR family transcriptional regulator